jgi:hypothetical protein
MRLPVPPSAAAAPAAPGPLAAPRTTVAPFQAVPTPDSGDEPAPAAGRPAEPPRRRASDRVRLESGDAGEDERARPSSPPAATPPAGAAPGYRDWTSPSRTRDEPPAPPPATEAIPDRAPAGSSRAVAPATEAIPDRTPTRDDVEDDVDAYEDDRYDRLDGDDDRLDDEEDHRGPVTGSSTGVVGGRAAFRTERQAAEAERLRAVRAARQEEGRGSGVRRAAVGLLAMAVVALVVLGVYSFASPAQEASRSATSEPLTTAAPPAVPSSALPPLDIAPLPPVDAAPAAPVRVPVTVLNATDVSGLAGDVAAELTGGGWEAAGVGAYQGGDVATTTVYYTEGDQTQYDAAVQLVQQFPQISGPAVRFFEVPDAAAPGLVVVTTGEWLP